MSNSARPFKPTPGKRSLPRLRRRLGRGEQALLVCAALYLVAGLGCGSFQRRFIYFPSALPSQKVDELARSERLSKVLNTVPVV